MGGGKRRQGEGRGLRLLGDHTKHICNTCSFLQSLVVDCHETLFGFRLEIASFEVQFSSPESGSILPVDG